MSKRKTHRVFARDKNVMIDGLKTSKGTVDFGTQSAVYVDESTAKEVEERYGRKGEDSVFVAKDEQYDRALEGEGWKIQYDRRGDWVKTVHKYRFSGVDTSHIRTTRDNGLVWVYRGGKQVLMKRKQALEEGYDIVPQKRIERRKGAEVTNDNGG